MQLSANSNSAVRQSSIGLIIIGLVGALIAGAVMLRFWLFAPFGEVVDLLSVLSTTSIISLVIGFMVNYYFARVSPSLLLTLALAYVWAAVLMILNVWNGARLMFFNSDHDLPLAVVLLVFASIVATTFGLAVTLRVVSDLRELSRSAEMVSRGNLSARAQVNGRDEVSHVAESFNTMAEQLQAAESMRQELDQLRRDLVSWTSHDLRTPLTSTRAMVEALNDGIVTDAETTQRYYKNILQDINSLSRMMDDLFEYAQLESGGLKITREPEALSDLISDTLEQFHAVANKRDIELTGRVDDGIDPVSIDASLVSRVLANLVSNALRHTPDGGSIEISAELRPDDCVKVNVADSGPGFETNDIGRVFEQFYRGEQARRRATGGAGLGLAIAKSIIDGHDGIISAANRPEGGAVVSFELPRDLISPPL